MTLKLKLNNLLLDYFGFKLEKTNPRGVILFAKNYFPKDSNLQVIEIGTYKGHHAKSILKTLPVRSLFCIDPYKEYNEEGNTKSLKGIEKEARKRLNDRRVHFIKKESNKAVKGFTNIDLVYIDGNHEYSFVKEDIELYWNVLNSGGILGGHDFFGNYTSVMQAVLEFCQKKDLKLHVGKGRDWWVIKEKNSK